mgnify:CR=1 FL=1
MTQILCPVCTKLENEINNDSSEIIWSKNLCENCQDMKSRGFIFIGAVEDKTEDATNPYRSGNVWCVEQEVAEQVFAPHGAPASGIAFIDVKVADAMKLPGVNLNA